MNALILDHICIAELTAEVLGEVIGEVLCEVFVKVSYLPTTINKTVYLISLYLLFSSKQRCMTM